jgi:hypothetical protein
VIDLSYATRAPVYTARVFIRESERPVLDRRVALWLADLEMRGWTGDAAALRRSLERQAISRVTGLPLEVFAGETVEIVTLPDAAPLPGEAFEAPRPNDFPAAQSWAPKTKTEPLPGAGRFARLERPLVTL